MPHFFSLVLLAVLVYNLNNWINWHWFSGVNVFFLWKTKFASVVASHSFFQAFETFSQCETGDRRWEQSHSPATNGFSILLELAQPSSPLLVCVDQFLSIWKWNCWDAVNESFCLIRFGLLFFTPWRWPFYQSNVGTLFIKSFATL